MRRKNRTARADGHHPGDYEKPKPQHDDYTTARAKVQPNIAWLLSVGSENAICMSELAKIVKKPTRQIRRMIQLDRKNGYPICADNKSGYFLPKTEAEKLSCVMSMRRRAAEVNRSASAIARGRVRDAEEESG